MLARAAVELIAALADSDMTGARALLSQIRDEGLSISLDGMDIVIESDREPAPELLARVRAAKAEIVFLLLAVPDLAEWLGAYTERAAIAEFDGQQSHHDAEAMALRYCYARWLAERCNS